MIGHLRHGLARRKRRLTVAVLVLVALALAAGVWAGGGAGFTRVTTSTTISTSPSGTGTAAASGITVTATLRIDFRDVFGSADVATVTASVDHVTFRFVCINNGGNNPKADSKDIQVPGSGTSGNFPVDKNGNVTGFLVLSSSVDGSLSPCSAGQMTQVSATFFIVHLEDNATPPHTFDIPSVTTDTVSF
jgi:hypothetical protein